VIVDDLRDTPIGRGLEAALRLKLGAVYAGGKIAGVRRGLAGVGKKETQELIEIIEEAAFDPELMGLLLGRKLKVGSPEWNSRLNTRLGLGEGARAVNEDDSE
jgi:hypothetical protein